MPVKIAGFELPTLLEICKRLTGNENMCEILAGVRHEKPSEALLADIVDFVPIIGDVLNVSRVVEAREKRSRLLQIIDFILGETQLPDILPSNLIRWYETHKEKPLEEVVREVRETMWEKIQEKRLERGR